MRTFLTAVVSVLLLATHCVAAEPGGDGWIKMFDGKTLAGWKASEIKESWKVADGAIVAQGKPRSHLFYVGDGKPFVNFEFEAEVLTRPGANAGIYFHSKYQETGWPKFGYEVQINNTHRDPIKTGSIYQVVSVNKAPAEDDKWFRVSLRVEGQRIVTKVDGKKLVDYTEPDDKLPGKDFTRILSSGTFCLQAHDPKSIVLFKNLRVRRLP